MSTTQTFINLIQRSVKLYGERDAFRIRTKDNFRSVTFNQLHTDVCNLAAALESRALSKSQIALIGENSYEWVVTYLAVTVSGGTIIPIDKELSLPEISNILEASEALALFCSDDYSEDVADELKKNIELNYFIINVSKHSNYTTLLQLIDEGMILRAENPEFGQNEEDETDIASIVFTSGTTGFSKGVMLSRKNLLTNVESSDEFIKLGDCVLSVLPMHHTYEFTLDILLSIYQGRAVAINNGIKYFAQNIKLFAPSDILMVPLVAENLLKNIWQNAQNQNKDTKLRKALIISNFLLRIGIDIRKKLFKDVHTAMGGNLRRLFVGGAPLDLNTAKGLRELGFRIYIGYGITECSPLVTGNITNRLGTLDSCGVTIPGVEIRLYNPNESGEGEVQVRGESVMEGYYKNEEATKTAFVDGWFCTGDIGRMKSGRLYITGRVKNMIVLKNGKNIYPEELEALIEKIPQVKEAIIRANENATGEEVSIVAEIFPDLEQHPSPDAAIRAVIDAEIRVAIDKINDTLPYYKRIVDIIFRDTEFPKTTTKKIKRY